MYIHAIIISEIFSAGACHSCILPNLLTKHSHIIKYFTINLLFFYYLSIIWTLYANGYISVIYWQSSFIWSIVVYCAIIYIMAKWINWMLQRVNMNANVEQFNLIKEINDSFDDILTVYVVLSFILYFPMLIIKNYYESPRWYFYILLILIWDILCMLFYYVLELHYRIVRTCIFMKSLNI